MDEQERKPLTAGMAVKLARIRDGLTQEDLAKTLSMDRSRLSRIESGKLVNIRIEEVGDLHRVLGVDPQLWLEAAGIEASS